MLQLDSSFSNKDFQSFVNIIKQDYANGLKNTYGMTSEKARKTGDEEIDELIPYGINTKDHFFYKIEMDGKWLGGIWIALETKYEAKQMFLYYVYIFEEFRKKGFASQALTELSNLVKEHFNLDEIFLNHFHSNNEGAGLYKSLNCTTVKSTLKITYQESE